MSNSIDAGNSFGRLLRAVSERKNLREGNPKGSVGEVGRDSPSNSSRVSGAATTALTERAKGRVENAETRAGQNSALVRDTDQAGEVADGLFGAGLREVVYSQAANLTLDRVQELLSDEIFE